MTRLRIFRKIIRAIRVLLISIFGFVVLLFLVLNFSDRFVTNQVNRILDRLSLPIHLQSIHTILPYEVSVEGVLISGVDRDTLIYAGEVDARISLMQLLKAKVSIKELNLDHVAVNLSRESDSVDLDIAEAFSQKEKIEDEKQEKEPSPWEISITKANLSGIRFQMNDFPSGLHMDHQTPEFLFTDFLISLKEQVIRVESVGLNGYQGKIVLTPSETKKKGGTSAPWNYSLKEISLQNLDFTFQDTGDSLKLMLGLAEGEIRAKQVDIPNKLLGIENIDLSHPSVTLLSGASQENIADNGAKDNDQGFRFPWDITLDEMLMEAGQLTTGDYSDQEDQPARTGLEVSGIEIDMSDLKLSRTDASLALESAQLEATNGFILKDLEGNLSSDERSSRMDLSMRTGNSDIRLQGETSGNIFQLFNDPSSVREGHLELFPSAFSLKDMGCMITNLKEYPWYSEVSADPYLLAADLKLSDSQLSITGTSVSQPENFSVHLEGSATDPFTPSATRFNMTLNIPSVDGNWLQEITAGFGLEGKVPDLDGLAMEARISESYDSPSFSMNLQSSLGQVELAGSVDLGDHYYNLQSSVHWLMLGELLSAEDLGSFTGSVKITGTGWEPASITADVDLKVDTLGYKGYNYTATAIEGSLLPGVYRFDALIDDPSISGILNAELNNPSDSALSLNATASIRADLHELNLYRDTLLFETEGDLFFRKTLQTVESNLNVSGLKLATPDREAEIEGIQVNLITDTTRTRLTATSDFFQVESDIGIALDSMGSLGHSYQDYVHSMVDTIYENDSIRVSYLPEMRIQGSMTYNEILNILLDDTTARFSNFHFALSNNSSKNSIKYELGGEDLKYKGFRTGDLKAVLTDSGGTMDLQIDALDNMINSTPAKHLSIDSRFADWKSLTRLALIDRQDRTLYQLEVASELDSNQLCLNIPSRQMILNNNLWEMDAPELLTVDLATGRFYPSLQIHHDNSSIGLLSEELSDTTQYMVSLDNVSLASVLTSEIITGNPSGSITGSMQYRTWENEGKALGTSLQVDSFQWSELNFNQIDVDGSLQSGNEGKYTANLTALLDTSKVELSGSRMDSLNQQIEASFTSVPIITFQPFLRDYLSDMKGKISGKFNLRTEKFKREFGGGLFISDAGVRVNTLNTRFRIPRDSIVFKGRRLIFNRFAILDSLDNELEVDGYVDFPPDGPIMTNLDIVSSKLQVMNKEDDKHASFYGNAIVDSRMKLRGPLENPTITGKIVLDEGSDISYRHTEDLSISESEKIIDFVSYSEQGELQPAYQPVKAGTLMNTSIETEVEIAPSTKIGFSLSKQIYDISLEIRGGGVLNYQMRGNNQNFLSGRYEVREGRADVKIVGWPNKTFRITQGGYIRWDGLIENPELKFEAVNRVRVSYINPVDGKSREVDFNVVLQLANRLSELDVLFTVNTPDQYLMSIINTLSPEEQMKQAITVLLFERVDLPGISTSTDYMTQQVNQIMASQLNQLTSTTIQGVEISFGIDSYVAATQDGGQQTMTSLSYDVRKGLMNERAQIEVSGRLNDLYNQPGASDLSFNNISFEYRLDSAATKFFKVYNEHAYEDVFEGEVVSTGVGFTFRKRFSTLRNIWRKERKKGDHSD